MGLFQVFLLFSLIQVFSSSQDSREQILQRSYRSKIIRALESFVENTNRNPRSKILNSLESFLGSNSLDISISRIRKSAGDAYLISKPLDKNRPKEKESLLSSELVDHSGSGAENWKGPNSQDVRHSPESFVTSILNSNGVSENKLMIPSLHNTENSNQSLGISAPVQNVEQSSDKQKGTMQLELHESVSEKNTSQRTTEDATKPGPIQHDKNTSILENEQEVPKVIGQQYANRYMKIEKINQDITSSEKRLPKLSFHNEPLDIAGSRTGFESSSGSGSGSGSESGSGSGMSANDGEVVEKIAQNLNDNEDVPSSPSPSSLQAPQLSLQSASSQREESFQKNSPVRNLENFEVETRDSSGRSESSGSGSSESGSGSGMLIVVSRVPITRKSSKDSEEEVPNIPEPNVYVDVDGDTKPNGNSTILSSKTKEPTEEEDEEVNILIDFNGGMDQPGSPSIGNVVASSTEKGSVMSDNKMQSGNHKQSASPNIVEGTSDNEIQSGNHKQSESQNSGDGVASLTENGSVMSESGNHKQSGNPIDANGATSSTDKGSAMSDNKMQSGNYKQSASPNIVEGVGSSTERGNVTSDNEIQSGNHRQSESQNSGNGVGSSTEKGSVVSDSEMQSETLKESGSSSIGNGVASSTENVSVMSDSVMQSGIHKESESSNIVGSKGVGSSTENSRVVMLIQPRRPINDIVHDDSKSYKKLHKLIFSTYNNHSKQVLNKKTKEDEELEQEKKLIALSATTQQIDASTSVTFQTMKIKQFHPSNGTTKEVKQDYDLTIEKEKKLIADSVKNFDSGDNGSDQQKHKKVSNSAELHDHAKSSFRSRYFEEKGRKVIKKYKEDKLASLLEALRFGKKSSTVMNSTVFRYIKQCGLFVEDYNVTKTGGSWDGGILSQYRYLYEIPEHFSRCSTTAWFNHTDMRGSVYLSFQVRSILGNTMMNNAHVCAKYCCREPRCKAWTMRIQEGETRNCDKGSYCCWLKSSVPEVHSGVENSTSGIVDRVNTKHPATGMRSAVPLGGITTGSFELHADGTFHEWTIENQSPGGSAKLNKGSLDMALLGVRVSRKNTSEAALLRTQPPQGYPGVEALSYSGAYPLSKLALGGRLADKVNMDLYAYPSFHPRNPYDSAIPAVAFTLNLENKDLYDAINVSFMLNLPLGYQDDTIRMGSNYGEAVFTKNILPSECAKACAKMPKCMAWTTNGPTACLLKDKMPLHAWQGGIISGLKGVWSKNGTMLTMKRPGFFPQSGSTSLFAVGGEGETTSFASADDFAEIWNRFSETGLVGNTTNVTEFGLHGSASIQATLQPGQKKSLTIIMSWYYPNRDQATVNIGNFYSNLFTSSQEAALHMHRNILQTVTNILEWQVPFLLPSSFVQKPRQYINKLPLWLNDMLMNSVSYWRSSFWTKDGRWRQWEAYDCNDVDTIHNDMQRILPYMLFYPEVVRHLLLSWAANQYTNGMLQEALTEGCLGTTGKLDYAGGREMSDSTSMFVVGVYHYYKWTGEKDLLHKLWPATKRAITWLIVDGTKHTGLPFRKTTFYSMSGIDKYDHHIYDSVVYLLALRASRRMATYLNDDIFEKTVTAAIDRAQSLIDKEFWDKSYHHYRAWWDLEYGAGDWLMSDSFYGQVWANTLGLGDLVPRSKLRRHLDTEVTINGSPWGLRVIDDKRPAMTEEDTSLILSYKYPGCESLESVAKHKAIWMGADANWASLMINLETDPHKALEQAKKPLDHWRSTINDQWNIHGQLSSGGYGQDGLPWANSHANAHLVMWHIPFAISGQQYSAPDRSLTFWPKFGAPFELPFFTPTASGIIEGRMSGGNDMDQEEMFTFKVTSGEVHLRELKIFHSPYANGEIHLIAGSVVTWSKPKTNVKNILNELKH